MNPITIPNISIPTIGIPTIGIPSVGFPSASGGGGLSWPAGMKEHIKAWYDPKKQGMTNYDVIEAYTEDFTTWKHTPSRGNATITTNKIIITSSTTNDQNIVEDVESPYDDIKIYVTGVSKDNPLTINQFADGWVTFDTYTTNGVYTIKNRGFWVGFGTYKTDKCNITITQLPTSILKDLSGNGNHAYLYGGKGKLNSGMGLYTYDYNSDRWRTTERANFDITDNGFKFTNIVENGTIIYTSSTNICEEDSKVKVKVTGVPDGGNIYLSSWLNITKDGVYEGICKYDASGNEFVGTTNCIGATISLEFIPDYPNQLCYDGSMYAVCYGFPILTDYTVMAERTWFEKEEYSAFISNSLGGIEEPNNGAFCVEIKSLNSFTTSSFGSLTSIGIPEKGITYQTKQSYNGNSINVGTKESNDILILGGRYFYKNDNAVGNTWTGCHGAIIIADRSFTEEEINWLKQNWDKI